MTKIVATFSNGFTDEYKGKRPVKAAWMVVLPNGKIISGHSNNRATAEKTARNNAACSAGAYALLTGRRGRNTVAAIQWANGVAKEAGFKDYHAYDANQANKRAEFVAACKFEIIDL